MSWLFVLAGLVLLVLGGDALVRGASGLALAARIAPGVVGLTIVAAGTSTPELVVSVQSALEDRAGLALGNVVGSNLFNVCLILGITALVQPLVVIGRTVRFEWPVMMTASVVVWAMARDARIDRVEGLILLGAMLGFVAYATWLGRSDPEVVPDEGGLATASFGATGGRAIARNVGAVALGVATLAGGSTLLVQGASALARDLGLSETLIGLTIVAAGTSTPELVTSLVAVRRGQADIAIANVVGSNIFNLLGIAGATAAILPLSVPSELLTRDLPWMLGTSLLLLPLMWTGLRVSRREGAALLAIYGVYVVVALR